jgi:hypothetical protein
VTLELPEPPSVNRHASHHQVLHSMKRAYQRAAWAKACSQAIPPHEAPRQVKVTAHFRLHQLRDEDNLFGSLKWAIDSLRQKQTSRKWRKGIYEDRGFFFDDTPMCLELGSVTQEVNRSNRGLTLTITETAPPR